MARFTDTGDSVVDSITGLEWKKDVVNDVEMSTLKDVVDAEEGWRLPTGAEIASLKIVEDQDGRFLIDGVNYSDGDGTFVNPELFNNIPEEDACVWVGLTGACAFNCEVIPTPVDEEESYEIFNSMLLVKGDDFNLYMCEPAHAEHINSLDK